MAFIKSKEIAYGLNSVTGKDEQQKAGMQFDILLLEKGGVQELYMQGEGVLLLMEGKATALCGGESYEMERDSCFYDNPVSLHMPQGSSVRVTAVEESRFALMRTENDKPLQPALYSADQCTSEMRGEGTLNECSTRVVRNILSRTNCKNTNFVLGEVVNFPGKWSSYPPHSHPQPEIYYYRFLPEKDGYGIAQDGENAYVARDGDALLALDGNIHPQVSAPGYAMYYIWVIRDSDTQPYALPAPVKEHAWTIEPGAKFFPDNK